MINMKRRSVLLTGATGLVGVQLLRRLASEGFQVFALARGTAIGRQAVREFERLGNVRFIAADITRPRLGLDESTIAELRDSVGAVVHGAAQYRLDIDREAAWQTNVIGTQSVLELIEGWNLSAFHYLSSITVAGDCVGRVEERQLPRPARFRNHYEESKWSAERTVFERRTHPLRVYRPGIIVGDSRTGCTQKFDGPYPAFGLMRRFCCFPIPGHGRNALPLVSVDLVAETLLAGLQHVPTDHEVLHVIDSDPPTLREFAEAMLERLAGHRRVVSLPVWVFRSLVGLPGFARASAITTQAVEYMWADTTFDTARFRAFCRDHGTDARRVRASLDALALYYCLETGRRFSGALPELHLAGGGS
jgi:nucleoside-diphosphate-sugar epimerase